MNDSKITPESHKEFLEMQKRIADAIAEVLLRPNKQDVSKDEA